MGPVKHFRHPHAMALPVSRASAGLCVGRAQGPHAGKCAGVHSGFSSVAPRSATTRCWRSTRASASTRPRQLQRPVHTLSCCAAAWARWPRPPCLTVAELMAPCRKRGYSPLGLQRMSFAWACQRPVGSVGQLDCWALEQSKCGLHVCGAHVVCIAARRRAR